VNSVPGSTSDSKRRGRKASTESLVAVFPEAEFAPLLSKRIRPLLDLCQDIRPERNGSRIPKRVISALEDVAHDLETFLDDYDARSNQQFATFTEFVACARGFAEIARTIQHVLLRFPSYHGEAAASDDRFLKEAARTLKFADTSLRKLLDATVAEAAAATGRPRSRKKHGHAESPERGRRFLPHDIDEVAEMNDREKIAELASLYIAHKHTLDKLFDGRRIEGVAAMRRYVLEVSDEEQCRYFQTKIHNLQSKYDTFVKATAAEQKDPDLKRFRGYVSIALHLLECMTQLVHFYQRHENDIRGEQVKDRVAALIDKDEVLDRSLNFCLYYTHVYLHEGLTLAQSLVKRYTSQERIALDLPEGVHIHIRPASLIAEIVKHHGTPVMVTIGSDTRYAGSALDVLMAAGANAGDRTIKFEGDTAPLRDLRLLFENRLGEDGLSRLPRQLSYLKRPKRGP
jgi:phosphotransferase system HPr-like phosphotransfer protein